MPFNYDDTICAAASAPDGAARGIVRVSGSAALAITDQLFEACDRPTISDIEQAIAIRGRALISVNGGLRNLPCDLMIWPHNRSYTREPVIEWHTIGSLSLLDALTTALCEAGARLAEPGEFTLRAFLAGRIDLTQAEAVLGVIDARGERDLDCALMQLAGGISGPLDRLRSELLQLLAELEAGLDFVEEDIEFISPTILGERLEHAVQLLEDIAQQMDSRYAASDSAQIALVGPPNAGKSSLFNALVARFGCEAASQKVSHVPALVSPRRGTTRDYLTATISLCGISCNLTDTAGIDEHPASAIEADAQSLALEQRESAAICMLCVEAGDAADVHKLGDMSARFSRRRCDVLVLTKADESPGFVAGIDEPGGIPIVLTSSRTGQGLEELAQRLAKLLSNDGSTQRSHVVPSTAARCRESVRLAQTLLSRAAELVQISGGNELVAVELRAALEEVGRVVGAIYTNDLLDRIFGTFCIGK